MVTRIGLTASWIAISAGVLGVALWVVQLAVGLPSWLWWARLIDFIIVVLAAVPTWVLARRMRHQAAGN